MWSNTGYSLEQQAMNKHLRLECTQDCGYVELIIDTFKDIRTNVDSKCATIIKAAQDLLRAVEEVLKCIDGQNLPFVGSADRENEAASLREAWLWVERNRGSKNSPERTVDKENFCLSACVERKLPPGCPFVQPLGAATQEMFYKEAPWWLSCQTARFSPRRTGFNPLPGHSRIFASGNRTAGFLFDLPFPSPLHSSAAPVSPHFTLIGSQHLVVKSHIGTGPHNTEICIPRKLSSSQITCVTVEYYYTRCGGLCSEEHATTLPTTAHIDEPVPGRVVHYGAMSTTLPTTAHVDEPVPGRVVHYGAMATTLPATAHLDDPVSGRVLHYGANATTLPATAHVDDPVSGRVLHYGANATTLPTTAHVDEPVLGGRVLHYGASATTLPATSHVVEPVSGWVLHYGANVFRDGCSSRNIYSHARLQYPTSTTTTSFGYWPGVYVRRHEHRVANYGAKAFCDRQWRNSGKRSGLQELAENVGLAELEDWSNSISNSLSNSAQASWESQWEQRVSAMVGREREVWWSEQQWAKVSVGDGLQRSAGSERRSVTQLHLNGDEWFLLRPANEVQASQTAASLWIAGPVPTLRDVGRVRIHACHSGDCAAELSGYTRSRLSGFVQSDHTTPFTCGREIVQGDMHRGGNGLGSHGRDWSHDYLPESALIAKTICKKRAGKTGISMRMPTPVCQLLTGNRRARPVFTVSRKVSPFADQNPQTSQSGSPLLLIVAMLQLACSCPLRSLGLQFSETAERFHGPHRRLLKVAAVTDQCCQHGKRQTRQTVKQHRRKMTSQPRRRGPKIRTVTDGKNYYSTVNWRKNTFMRNSATVGNTAATDTLRGDLGVDNNVTRRCARAARLATQTTGSVAKPQLLYIATGSGISRQDTVQSTVGSYSFFYWLKHVLVRVNCLRTNHGGAMLELRNPEWLSQMPPLTLLQTTIGRRIGAARRGAKCATTYINFSLQRHDGNTARLARRSYEALEVHVSVARIAPSLLDLGRGREGGPSHSLQKKMETLNEEATLPGHLRQAKSWVDTFHVLSDPKWGRSDSVAIALNWGHRGSVDINISSGATVAQWIEIYQVGPQCSQYENTARRFKTLRLATLAHLMGVVVLPLSLPCFSTSRTEKKNIQLVSFAIYASFHDNMVRARPLLQGALHDTCTQTDCRATSYTVADCSQPRLIMGRKGSILLSTKNSRLPRLGPHVTDVLCTVVTTAVEDRSRHWLERSTPLLAHLVHESNHRALLPKKCCLTNTFAATSLTKCVTKGVNSLTLLDRRVFSPVFYGRGHLLEVSSSNLTAYCTSTMPRLLNMVKHAKCSSHDFGSIMYSGLGAAVAELLACSPPTKENWVQSPAGFLDDLLFNPPLHFGATSIHLNHPHWLRSPHS
ncbi:hypothetical protein PR048_018014 [Dryococelus australis]|uniref:Uncharacterized protein n=1 Tax=Dryococelus australis TaxID=614101 RepID=A0ABQ9HB40_9NEOP|nr:hypothetical protein PR048_018014 [Dryococelus australis]